MGMLRAFDVVAIMAAEAENNNSAETFIMLLVDFALFDAVVSRFVLSFHGSLLDNNQLLSIEFID